MQTLQMCILKAAVIQKNGLLKSFCDIKSVVFGSSDLWFQYSKIFFAVWPHWGLFRTPVSPNRQSKHTKRATSSSNTWNLNMFDVLCVSNCCYGSCFFRLTYWSSCVQVIGILQVRSELCEKPDKMFMFVQQLKTACKWWRNGLF